MQVMSFEIEGDLLKLSIRKDDGGFDTRWLSRSDGNYILNWIITHSMLTPESSIVPATIINTAR